MDERIRNELGDEILRDLEYISSLAPGSEEHGDAIEALSKLYKMGLDDVKTDIEYEEKVSRREMDSKAQKSEQKHRWLRNIIDAASILVPAVLYGVWMRRGFEFEKTGTYTSSTFRSLQNKMTPTKIR